MTLFPLCLHQTQNRKKAQHKTTVPHILRQRAYVTEQSVTIVPHVRTYAYTFKQAHILTHMQAQAHTDAFMVCRCPFNFLSWKLNPQSHMLMVLRSITYGKPHALKWLISHVLVHGGRSCYKEKAFWNIWSIITWYPLPKLRPSKTLTGCQINVSAHGLLAFRTASLANFFSL